MILRALDLIAKGRFVATTRDLAIARILLASLVLLTIVPRALHLADAPDALFEPPPGLPSLMPTPPPSELLLILNLAVTAFAAMLLCGLFTPVVSIALTGSLVVLNAAAYTTGKINHDILLVLMPAMLATSGWGRVWSLDAHRHADPEPGSPRVVPELATLALCIALAMAFAGLVKIASGWLSLDAAASLSHLASNYYVADRQTSLASFALKSVPAWIHECIDWLTVAFELAFLVALFAPALFRAVLVVAVAFHTSVLLLFDIAFVPNLVVYAAFAPFAAMLPSRSRQPGSPERARRVTLALALAAVALSVGAVAGNKPLAERLPVRPYGFMILVGAGVAAWFTWRASSRSARRARSLDTGPGPPVIYFDGACGICTRFVDFVIRRDKARRFRFASLQSEHASVRFARDNIDASKLDSIVVATDEHMLVRSDAVLAVARGIRWCTPIIALAAVIPSELRDVVYGVVARNRSRVFGKPHHCRILTPDEKEVFLDDSA